MMIPAIEEEEVNFSAPSTKTLNSHPGATKRVEMMQYDLAMYIQPYEHTNSSGINEGVNMYEEVTEGREPSQPAPDTTASAVPSPDNKAAWRCNYQLFACYLGALCAFLLLVVAGELALILLINPHPIFLWNKNYNLKNLHKELSSNHEELKRNQDNLTKTLVMSENRITNLTGENQQLETLNKTLTDQIKNMETTYGLSDVGAQCSINVFCPKRNDSEITCQFILYCWVSNMSTYYSYNAEEQRNWEEAQDDCRRKGSDLAVIGDQKEKNDITRISITVPGITGYWIGLRAVEGKWKWIDGTNLINQTWIQPPVNDDQCVISGKNQEWRSVSCEDKHAWICEERPWREGVSE